MTPSFPYTFCNLCLPNWLSLDVLTVFFHHPIDDCILIHPVVLLPGYLSPLKPILSLSCRRKDLELFLALNTHTPVNDIDNQLTDFYMYLYPQKTF